MSGYEKDKKPPAFLLSPAFQEVSRKAFEKHKASPEVSLKAYFAQRIRELQRELAGRKIIYLDTNHWINLRHVVLGSPREKPGYREILELLQRLHGQGRTCCPISFLLFIELMKQSDPLTRLQTAKLMDQFSDGVCFQFPLEMARTELCHFLLSRVPNLPRQLKAWVWTKTGFMGGELLPTLPSTPDATNNLIQKAWTDLMWAVGLEQVLEVIDSFHSGTDFWEKYAAASNADAVFYRSSDLDYAKVLEREKALLMRKLIAEELPAISLEMWDVFPQVRDPSKLPQPTESDYSPFNFPSLQILAGISAADMLSSKTFNSHDMLDFRHAALAIPYCDAVCSDHPMATRLRNKPCEFGKVYGTQILGRADEIVDYLKTLTR
jgi:hypothetical protein